MGGLFVSLFNRDVLQQARDDCLKGPPWWAAERLEAPMWQERTVYQERPSEPARPYAPPLPRWHLEPDGK